MKDDEHRKSGAIFIMPRSSKAWRGAEALWVTVAGWSAAGKRLLGDAWVVTADTIASPEEILHYPLGGPLKKSAGKAWIPLLVKTALKDFILWRESKKFRNKTL